jgi:protein-S-isoprenylcysteine O-methyltransferase Ste14
VTLTPGRETTPKAPPQVTRGTSALPRRLPSALRTKSAWLIVVPFFLLASPTRGSLVLGLVVSAAGLGLRGWSAGTIRKGEVLTTSGPYAYLRNPLYVGSFLIGAGLAVAGGSWLWLVLFVGFFVTVYGPTIAAEAERLTEQFGQRYVDYSRQVPAFVPRLSSLWAPFRASDRPDRANESATFRWSQYERNREWEALLGACAAYLALVLKLAWFG